MKAIVVIALVCILAALASAGFFMLRNKTGKRQMARALTVRIGVSVALFLFILLSWKMGWIEPHGLELQQR
ncbi:DUF2909 domain-containing protein [Paucibacter sp. R3-3]|uniref:DUF2909 domain-containing protein n=1 Tax=Roseateles agri TaxID=3098619 RepID=A0ABU5DAB6_9BURK|nr:DUF2909 domain-containing protein [Paucibacter sp. R3-3]MDY0743210.1 DUF2909 domain-containing protein [Paucibacter sp. R3-3]